MAGVVNQAEKLDLPKGLEGIPSWAVTDAVWFHVKPYIERVLARPEVNDHFTASDVRMAIRQADMQLWRVPGGYWVTRVVSYPRARVLELFAVAGEYQESWLTDCLEELKSWGRQVGCTELEMFGREGWARKCGFTRAYTAYRQDLNETED